MSVAISVKGLTKRFGRVHAVESLSFDVRAGAITGFLGRNGAGKTTTLRMIVGLAHPQQGEATILGKKYNEIDNPWAKVGSVLDAECFHPGRTGRNHLRWVAAAVGLADSRIDEVLHEVDLESVADRRVKGYSLGMRQRLALATALLGDPDILILDEPANGLDPQGMHWLRELLIKKAQGGKTVFLSSHVLAELAQFVDDIIVIEKGKLVKQGPLKELLKGQSASVHIRTPEATKLAEALRARGSVVEQSGPAELVAKGLSIDDVGDIALKAGVAVHALNEVQDSLEDAFLRLTREEGKK
jgi:ABC-2 type transport system ATP-binding protein